jgi:hypothetical protein
LDKQCSKCGLTKDTQEFTKCVRSRDGLRSYCRGCQGLIHGAYWPSAGVVKAKTRKCKARNAVNAIKAERACCICGEGDPCCLDFHHRSDKKFSISDAVKHRIGMQQLMTEIAKCSVVCANCHRKIHAGKLSLPEHPPSSSTRAADSTGEDAVSTTASVTLASVV